MCERPAAGEAQGLLMRHHGRGADENDLLFAAHGRRDPIMGVDLGRSAVELLQEGGLDGEYHESDAAHHIDPAHFTPAVRWLETTLSLTSRRPS